MSDDLLQQIQSLQFTQKSKAEALLQNLIAEMFALDIAHTELRPLAVSLNSFNGFITLADDTRLFFKTHTEPDSVVGEYYNSTIMADAGYPVIRPLYSSTEEGRQLLIYEVVDDPSVFDAAWAIEAGQSNDLPALTYAQHKADDQLLQLYLGSLEMQSADDAAQARVHQLFYHRLTGGRLEKFYGPLPGNNGNDVKIPLPDELWSLREARNVKWVINGQCYDVSLDDLIVQAIDHLNPKQAGPSIIGHGDAHNGNVFFNSAEKSLTYFDPAFAGRHHPLLDLTKPLFHNVFAMWLYFPREKAGQMRIEMESSSEVWHVRHNYALHPVRQMFLESKVQRVLIPIVQELKKHDWLDADWRRYLKSALFCCPFLTMNLADSTKFPPQVSLLGLTMAVEMGGESREKRSLMDTALDQVEERL